MAALSKKKNKNKFDEVRSSINTGLHVGNVKIIPKRSGELFRRLKTKEFVTLLQLHQAETHHGAESISNLIADSEHKGQSVIISHDALKENDHDENHPDYIPPFVGDNESSFLLLDIREEAEFDKYHIKGAKYYDTAQLRRDRMGKDIYAYKNKENKIIIVCCNEQKDGVTFANELFKKYIDNAFLLTTSVERFAIKFPDLCVGESLPKDTNNQDRPKAAFYAVDFKKPRPHKKIKPLGTRYNSEMSMSVMSNASTTRSWKP